MSKLTDHLKTLPEDADLLLAALSFIGDALDRIDGAKPPVGETATGGRITVNLAPGVDVQAVGRAVTDALSPRMQSLA